MNLRWLLGNYSDPEFTLSRREQREVTRLAHRNHLSKLKLFLCTGGMLVGSWLVIGFGWEPATALIRSAGIPMAPLVTLMVLCLVTVVVSSWLYRFIYVRPVRLAMRDLGYDICVGCGYRLTGLDDTIDRCPECGQPREPMPKKEPTDP
jgi:hypothetical protein